MYRDAGLNQHSKAESHVECYLAWKDSSKKTVLDMLTDERTRQIAENREYIRAVIDVLKLTAMQRLAQRGHDETMQSVNAGNFIEMLRMLGKYNTTIGRKLVDLPCNAKYTSHDIQNELLAIMGRMVRASIADEVNEAGEFSVMADETKDCSKVEQMSIVLRYFYNGSVYESFVGFFPLNSLTADSLSSLILSELQQLGIDYKSKMIAQGYDGASVMSGKNAGVAALIMKEAVMAIYVHCHAHRLNLALVDSVKSVPQACEFFALLENLYVFVSGSAVHARWIEIQREMHKGEKPRELQRLSETRWACRYAACRALYDRLPAVMQLLLEMKCCDNANRRIEARSLLAVIDVYFIFVLHLMRHILGLTQSLSMLLQSSTVDMSAAVELINVTKDELDKARTDDSHFCTLWDESVELCQKCDIDADERPVRQRKIPVTLTDSVVMETVGDRSAGQMDRKSFIRVMVYIPVIDNITAEFERRFSAMHCSIIAGIDAMNPSSANFADFDCLKHLAQHYKSDLVDLEHELHSVRRLIEKKVEKPATLVSFVATLTRYKDAFPEVYRLGKICIALPVSTAACERSFSALRHIKSWVRNSISHGKLCNVSLLAIERERAHALNSDAIVDAFAVAHKNRRIALL